MEKAIRYDKKRYESLVRNLADLKVILAKRKKFIDDYQEVYKLPKKPTLKKAKLYSDIIQAIELIETVEFRNNTFVKKD